MKEHVEIYNDIAVGSGLLILDGPPVLLLKVQVRLMQT
jgi:hypothetical protein